MTAYLVRRLLGGVPLILGVTLLTFVLFHGFAGDPVYQFLGKSASNAEVEALRKEYGFDRPLPAQYLVYLQEIARFDFGRSFVSKEPVRRILWRGVGPSLSLTLPALLLSTVLALMVSLISAFFRGRPLDRALVTLAVLGMSVSFLVYIVVGQYLLAFVFPIFQIHGYAPGFFDRWQFLALPIAILVIVSMGYDTRFFRSVMVEESSREYITCALSKGLKPARVMFVHVLKNALIPVLTRVMASLPFLVTGSLLLETFFGIPGLGSLLIDALDQADLPVIKAYTVMLSLLFVASTVATDLLYALVDPRVRLR